MLGRASSSLAFVLLAACAGSPPPAPPIQVPPGAAGAGGAPSATTTAVATSGPKARPPASRPGARASDELLRAWPFLGPRLQALVYVDLEGLFRTELMKRVVPDALALAKTVARKEQIDCASGIAAGGKEAAFGDEPGGQGALVMRLDPASARATAASCAAALGDKALPTVVNGADAAWSFDEVEILAVKGPIVVLARPEMAEDALAGRGNGAGLADVGLALDEYALVAIDRDDTKVHGALALSAERIHVRVEAAVTDEERFGQNTERDAARIKKSAARFAQEAKLDKPLADTLKRLLDALDVKGAGKKATITFDLAEPVDAQVKDLGAVAAMSKLAVQKYLVNAKTAEARNTVGAIARSVVTEFEAERMGPDGRPVAFAKKKLVSFPPVPKTVPKGVKVQTTETDWRPWAPIRFELTSPQYFQYEVKAAKDGQSCVIVARGDLNGDGKTSRFELTIARKGEHLAIEPGIKETDPEE